MTQLWDESSYHAKTPTEEMVCRAAGVASRGSVENMRSRTTRALPEVWVRVSKGLKSEDS